MLHKVCFDVFILIIEYLEYQDMCTLRKISREMCKKFDHDRTYNVLRNEYLVDILFRTFILDGNMLTTRRINIFKPPRTYNIFMINNNVVHIDLIRVKLRYLLSKGCKFKLSARHTIDTDVLNQIGVNLQFIRKNGYEHISNKILKKHQYKDGKCFGTAAHRNMDRDLKVLVSYIEHNTPLVFHNPSVLTNHHSNEVSWGETDIIISIDPSKIEGPTRYITSM